MRFGKLYRNARPLVLALFFYSYSEFGVANPYDETLCQDGDCHGDGGAGIVAFLIIIAWWSLSRENKALRLWFTYVIGGIGALIIYNSHKPFKLFIGGLMIAAVIIAWLFAEDTPLEKRNSRNNDEQNSESISIAAHESIELKNVGPKAITPEITGSIENKREISRSLITDYDVETFGEDFIDVTQRAARESRFIDDSYMLNELTSSYISQDDIDGFGGDFVYMARRVMEDVKRIAGISNSINKSFIRPNLEDENVWGSDVLNLFYRVAQEELKVVIDIEDYPLEPKYYPKKCPFCGGSILRSTRLCESCQTGFSVDTLN